MISKSDSLYFENLQPFNHPKHYIRELIVRNAGVDFKGVDCQGVFFFVGLRMSKTFFSSRAYMYTIHFCWLGGGPIFPVPSLYMHIHLYVYVNMYILIYIPGTCEFVLCLRAYESLSNRRPFPIKTRVILGFGYGLLLLLLPVSCIFTIYIRFQYDIASITTVKPYNKKLCHCCQTLAAFLMGTGAVRKFFRAETLGAHF